MNPHSRSKDIVEPLMKPQWYVSCTDMGKQAADAVREGRLKIIPDHHLKTWFNWMDNIRWVKGGFRIGSSGRTTNCQHLFRIDQPVVPDGDAFLKSAA